MIKYWLLMPINLAVLTLACILAPVLPLTAIGRETLPNWLSWFQKGVKAKYRFTPHPFRSI